jgi:hypothetical protein
MENKQILGVGHLLARKNRELNFEMETSLTYCSVPLRIY